MYEVVLSPKARKFFEQAAADLQRRLDRCFDQFKADPRGHRNVKRLSGSLVGYYRFRVGNYRVIYRGDDAARTVSVAWIGHRQGAY